MNAASRSLRKNASQTVPLRLLEEAPSSLLLNPEVLGRLRRELFWTVGEEKAHGILARWGYSLGQASQLRNKDLEPLVQGLGTVQHVPQHSLSGEEHACDVNDSAEAKEHLRFFSFSHAPQCSILSGYLTGVFQAQRGLGLYFIETQCQAKKDPRCHFVGKTKEAWAKDPSVNLTVFDEDNAAHELKYLRDKLKLTKDRFQNLFEQSSMAIFIIDPDTGAYLNANVAAEQLTGYARKQLLQMTVFDLRHAQEHRHAMNGVKELLASGETKDREVTIVRRDGLARVIAESSKIISYGGRRVIQTIMRDISDLKLSEQKEKDLQSQLVRSERLSSIGRLAAGVAHELKNPLGAIRNAVYYIKEALSNTPLLETDPHLKEILRLTESEVDASVTIIGELLDFSQVVQLVPRRTQINELLEKIPSTISIPDNIQLQFDLDITLPSATVDPERLNQVFRNIATNAIQAMPNGGQLKIKTSLMIEGAGEAGVTAERIVILFEDTGMGINPLHLHKIFEPLFTTKARGTGLGLAISRNIIEKHGGSILANSQIGKGTSFIIRLPLRPPTEQEGQPHEHA